MYSSTSTSSPSSSFSEKFLSLEEQFTDEQLSKETIDRILLARCSSRWPLFLRHALIHAALLTAYTAIVFSFWPKIVTEDLLEAYSK
jgi:hypothetical protein